MALTFVVSGAIAWLWWRVSSTTPLVQPALDRAQAHALPTYQRSCRKTSDCDGPLLCMLDPRVADWRCLASECQTDFQCEPGMMCVPVIYPGAPSIGLCLVQGTQEEGDRCDEVPLKAEWGCRPGLLCSAGFCGRPCRRDASLACPDGYTCQSRSGKPSCLPSCLRTGCLPEKRCIQFDGELSVCATVHGRDCERQPCAEGQQCRRVLGTRSRGREVNMWCSVPCDPKDSRACPSGSTCFDGYCERLCDEGIPGACAPDERCTRVFNPERIVSICLVTR